MLLYIYDHFPQTRKVEQEHTHTHTLEDFPLTSIVLS